MNNAATLIKFCVTGVGATAIHMLVVFVLIGQWSWDVGLSNGLAFCVATVFSNYINTVWSFKTTMSQQVVIRFWSVSLIGCGLAVVIAKLIEAAGHHYAVGVITIAALVPLVTFTLHKFWTYRGA